MSKVSAGGTLAGESGRNPGSAPAPRISREGILLRQGQQAAAAELGLRAIEGVPLEDLYAYAVELVKNAMGVDFVYVVQMREGNEVIVRAHVGRTDMNPVGRVLDARGSIADFVIRTGEPAITFDFDSEERFRPPPAVHEVSARCAAAVPVHGRRGPFGALVVMNRKPYEFQPDDIAFLQTAANVLAAAVDRAADSAALRRQQELFRAITEHGSEMVTILQSNGTIGYVSPVSRKIMGVDAHAFVGRHFREFVHPDDLSQVTAAIDEAARDSSVVRSFTTRVRRPDGSCIHLAGTAYNMLHHSAVQGIVVNARDVTEMVDAQAALHRSQEQLHQALKMEAVGRLAGGIAHDFNNLLTAIRGYSDMLDAALRPGDPLRTDVQEIQHAADRAASLTHQLLAFSRRQVLRPDIVDLSNVVLGLESMVRRLIGEDIELLVAGDGKCTVLVDRGQLEQVIVNLAINARDAMPAGGQLTIETRDTDVPPSIRTRDGAPPAGRYGVVRISDSGMGIPAEFMDRIFEPFFTTKAPGKGTGLGLSTAYGIVKQSGGFIDVASVHGGGTTFGIYLPEAAAGVTAPELPEDAAPATQGSGGETILLVEDSDAVRQVVLRALRKAGYRVFEAGNGPQAIGVALKHANEIDLLLTDFVMPHMGGRELIDRLRTLGLQPRVLIMSGYIDDALLRGGGFPAGAAFIEKPFSAEGISRKVRQVLDSPVPAMSLTS